MKISIQDYFVLKGVKMDKKQTLRVGVGGPVGSGKTALLKSLCLAMRDTYNIAVVTNDIYTKEKYFKRKEKK